ncbi:hypothetical protein [Mycobacterium talmoniae]|uniref:Uncharacterized protein n=1 Tax=Mycobacterium talmoniae TaxID=1858794 RepID=A0A2S8BMJ7_9MYCO|nr:hypothetical protein [Mycobacterium talmoniae]PQM47796.1 hypothetical protein C1Y40_01988 [Mycobacterium talmoniae]
MTASPDRAAAWPRQRWRRLGGSVFGTLFGGALALAMTALVIPPLLIWSHAAGDRVAVRGTETVRAGSRGFACMGWVLPAGAPIPVRTFDGYMMPGITRAERKQVHRVQVIGANSCTDGDYWALSSRDSEVWARNPAVTALFGVIVKLGLGLSGLGLAARGARRSVAVVRGDPSGWDPDEERTHRRPRLPKAGRAESLLIRTAAVLGVMIAVCVAGSLGLGAGILLGLIGVGPVLGFVGAAAAIVVCVRLNRRLSRAHRARIRRHGTPLHGKVVDCRESLRPRPNRRIDPWVTLTVQFDDADHPTPRWLRRAYRFSSDETDIAAAFARRHHVGAAVTVYRGRHQMFYLLDVDDAHLSWPQWW